MQRHILALAATLAAPSLALAQTYRDSAGTLAPGVAPLVGCTPSGTCAGPVSASNPLPVTGTFSASLSGFAPGSAYATPLAVSTTSARVALPAGTVIVVYNTGSSAAFVQLGGAAVTATTANDVVAPGGWMAFTVGANGFLAAVTASGTTSLNISGGSGLPTGAAGGAGGASLPTGTAGAPNGAVVTVQGVAGGVAQPVTLGSLPPLAAGASTIGAVSQANGPWTVNETQLSGVAMGGATAWGTAPAGNVQGVNANVLALPSLPAGANTIGTVNAAQSGAWNIGNVTGTVSLPTGAATAGNQTNVQSAPGTAQTTAVTIQGNPGGLAVPVSGTVAATQSGTWNIGAVASLPSLPAGTNTIGTVNAAQSGAWNIGNVTGTVSLPTGAATAGNQTNVQSAPGAAQTTAVTIQGNPGGLAVPVSGTVAATQSGTWNIGAVASLPSLPAGTNAIGSVTVANLPATQAVATGDPCFGSLKSSAAFSSASGQFRIIAGAASKKTYVCHISYRVSSAVAVSVIEGTGTNCATGAAAVDGSTTAANGKAEAANGGEAAGNGAGDVMHAAVAADDLCLLQSGAAIIAGRVTYVQQ